MIRPNKQDSSETGVSSSEEKQSQDRETAPVRSSRRQFLERLTALSVGVAAFTIDPKKALAQTGEKGGKKPAPLAKLRIPPTVILPEKPFKQWAEVRQDDVPFTPPGPAGVPYEKLLPGSLLDEAGHLRSAVLPKEFEAWKAELKKRSLEKKDPARAALLRLWVGEYELAVNEEPVKAREQFKKAQSLADRKDRLYGWARYAEAIALFYDSRYDEAAAAFLALLNEKDIVGVDRPHVAFWSRHAGAHAADHAALGKLGIPRPLSLDPLCGAAGIALCLKAFKLPCDKKTVLAKVRHTGRGSNLQDLADACAKFGLVGHPIVADEAGLKALPKPLIAHVERDHFVTVLEADDNRVVYACNDCGPWPGGRLELTWEQWRKLKPGIYLAVVRPGSAEAEAVGKVLARASAENSSAALARLGKPSDPSQVGVQVASAGVGALGLKAATLEAALVGHAVAWPYAVFTECGYAPAALQCPPGTCCPMFGIGPGGPGIGGPGGGGPGGGTGGGPSAGVGGPGGVGGIGLPGMGSIFDSGWMNGSSAGDPVNLATGEEEYTPAPDLTVYNPNGPSVVWSRLYNSLRGATSSAQTLELGQGWSQSYNINVYDPNAVSAPGTPVWNQIPQDTIGQVTPTGTTPPASSPGWEIRHNGVVIATNTNPNGWYASYYAANYSPPFISVGPPLSATVGSGYSVRISATERGGSSVVGSGEFSVTHHEYVPQAGTLKYLVFANGARIPFTPPSLPTAINPTVVCAVGPGYGIRIEMCYSATDPSGYYVITFPDNTKWVTTTARGIGWPIMASSTRALYYPLAQQVNAVGNAIGFEYDTTEYQGTNAFTAIFPLLSRIRDLVSGNVLLTINRLSYGPISSITDCYGRSVYYTVSGLGITRGLVFVSQIVPTGTSNPPMRYQYGYSLVYNGFFSETTPMLTTISVPSPTGTGTSTTTINYSPGCQISSIVDANGNTTEFTQVNPDGTPWSGGGGYSQHTRITVKDPLNNVVYTSWVGFDGNMSQTEVFNAAGASVIEETYADPMNPLRASTRTDAGNRAWSSSWDEFGNQLSVTTPRGVTTTFTHSYANFSLGRLVDAQIGTLPVTTIQYNLPSGLASQITKPVPSGGTGNCLFSYNALGNVTSVSTPGNNVASQIVTSLNYVQDGAYTQVACLNQPLVVTDGSGRKSRLRYNSQGRVLWVIDPENTQTDFEYDIANNVTRVLYHPTGQQGPNRGNITTTYLYPGGPSVQEKVYDEAGNLIRQVNFTYGAEGELLSITGSVETIVQEYDALYRLKAVKDGNANTVKSFTYSAVGYLASVQNSAGTMQYLYNPDGRPYRITDVRGQINNLYYNDPDGLLTRSETPNQIADMTYDGYGRLQTVTDGVGTRTYTYGDVDQILSITTQYTNLPPCQLTYGYYPNGSRATLGTPAGTFTYLYDAYERLAQLTNPYGEVTSWTHTNADLIATQVSGNGLTATAQYTALGQLASLTNVGPGSTPLSEFLVTARDGSGNPLSVTANVPVATALSGSTVYTYDAKDQLVAEQSTRNGGYLYGYAYDSAGNATTFRNASLSYNALNQCTSASATYDGDGQPAVYNGQSLTWGDVGSLEAVGSLYAADYAFGGLRAWGQPTGGPKTYYIYDDTLPVLELDSSGNVASVNTFGNGGLLSRRSGGSSVYYAFDERGNTVHRLDQAGAVLSNRSTDAFGASLVPLPAQDPFDGFGGRLGYLTEGATGLVRCGYRDYSPAYGRWLAPDPMGYHGGVNIYSYCLNNPVRFADPLGLFALPPAVTACLVGALIAGIHKLIECSIAGNCTPESVICRAIGGCVAGAMAVTVFSWLLKFPQIAAMLAMLAVTDPKLVAAITALLGGGLTGAVATGICQRLWPNPPTPAPPAPAPCSPVYVPYPVFVPVPIPVPVPPSPSPTPTPHPSPTPKPCRPHRRRGRRRG